MKLPPPPPRDFLIALVASLILACGIPAQAHDDPEKPPYGNWDGMIWQIAEGQLVSPAVDSSWSALDNVTFGSSVKHRVEVQNHSSGDLEYTFSYKVDISYSPGDVVVASRSGSRTVTVPAGLAYIEKADLAAVRQLQAGSWTASAYAAISRGVTGGAHQHYHPFAVVNRP